MPCPSKNQGTAVPSVWEVDRYPVNTATSWDTLCPPLSRVQVNFLPRTHLLCIICMLVGFGPTRKLALGNKDFVAFIAAFLVPRTLPGTLITVEQRNKGMNKWIHKWNNEWGSTFKALSIALTAKPPETRYVTNKYYLLLYLFFLFLIIICLGVFHALPFLLALQHFRPLPAIPKPLPWNLRAVRRQW